MKKIIILNLLLVVVLAAYAQRPGKDNQAYEHFADKYYLHGNSSFGNKIDKHDFSDTLEPGILKKFNSNFRVLDSVDYYTGEYEKWTLESRFKSGKFDFFGNSLDGSTYFYHSDTDTWSDKYRFFWTYKDPVQHTRSVSHRQVWNPINNTWNTDYYVKHFGSSGYTELVSKDWNFKRNKFTGGYRYSYIINDSNLPSQRLVQKLDTITGEWYNEMRYSYTYTITGNYDEISIEIWNKTLNQWYVSRNDIYNYDINDNNTSQLIQYWSNISGWINGYLIENTFTNDGLLYMAVSKKWNTSTLKWEVIQINENLYNEEDKISETLISRKDPFSDALVNAQRLSYNYDNKGKRILYLSQSWDINTLSWLNVQQDINQYDPQENMILFLRQVWDKDKASWTNNTREMNTFIQKGFNVRYIKQIWDDSSGNWMNNSRRDSYYSGIKVNHGRGGNQIIADDRADNRKSEQNEIKLNLYPNPVHDILKIGYYPEKPEPLKIQVYTPMGILIINKTLTPGVTSINVTSFTPGTYIIRSNSTICGTFIVR